MRDSTAPAWLVDEVRQAKRGRWREQIHRTSELLARKRLPTVCDSARCPNRGECYSHGTATFLILGDVCTRGCAFCAVSHGYPTGPLDEGEPERLACAVGELGLSHVVVTSVTRDDLADGGAGHYAKVVQALRQQCRGVRVELLVPDFQGSEDALATVLGARPDILAHNLETVPGLYLTVRRGADYSRSLGLLRRTKELSRGITTKSGIMLGLGETAVQIQQVLDDLLAVDCDMVTIGQYLAPSLAHAPVHRYVSRDEFAEWGEKALRMGFKSVASGTLVRSSYKASRFFEEIA